MRLEDKKEHILDFVIRDYIETAQPVSSGRISDKQSSAGSPATIRGIMLSLDEDGYLYQPHTSSGRAPTERGYRYFIDNLVGKPKASSKNSLLALSVSLALNPLYGGSDAHTRYGKHSHFSEFSADALGSLVNDFAHELGMFASAMIEGKRGMREFAGFHDVLSEPEFHEGDMLLDFGRMVDDIDSVMSEYRNALIDEEDEYNVWIGRENIYPGARKGSTLVARISLPEASELTFFAYGPTRMNYEKAIFKIKSLIEEI